MARASIEGYPCLTCKWFTTAPGSLCAAYSNCSDCSDCSNCSNTTNGNCNCLDDPEEGETICPYYVEVEK